MLRRRTGYVRGPVVFSYAVFRRHCAGCFKWRQLLWRDGGICQDRRPWNSPDGLGWWMVLEQAFWNLKNLAGAVQRSSHFE